MSSDRLSPAVLVSFLLLMGAGCSRAPMSVHLAPDLASSARQNIQYLESGAQLPVIGDLSLRSPAPEQHAQRSSRVSESYGKLPLHFEANEGQSDAQVKFLARSAHHSLFLTSSDAVLVLRKPAATGPAGRSSEIGAVVRMTFARAAPSPRVVGVDELPGKVHYIRGRDSANWRTDVSTYSKVRYADLYPGIDLVYYGNRRQLEYDFIVSPGADPKSIALDIHGAEKLEIDDQGDLVLHTAAGSIRQKRPTIYQEIDGVRKEISGGYVVTENKQVGFWLASFDANRPLVIDPVLSYSTYLGGTSDEHNPRVSIAVDGAGNAYITGDTDSTAFPTTAGAFQTANGGGFSDAVVTKLNAAGSSLVYSTYIGGSGSEFPGDIAVDTAGNAYITGITDSPDFPTTSGAFQTLYGGGFSDAFVAKLNAAGSGLVYSTYLGGTNDDSAAAGAIAVDGTGSAYVVGATQSADFPITAGAYQTTFSGIFDIFVTKLDPSGTTSLYSTYLGRVVADSAGLAVDGTGSAYVTGTASANFPTTVGAVQPVPTPGASSEAFVTKLNNSGSALVYSTFLGGSGQDSGEAIAVDSAGNAYVTGFTTSTNFPTTPGALQAAIGGNGSAFVSKLDPSGSAFVYSTYLGGTFAFGSGIAVDSAGNAYVTGGADDFPTTPAAFQVSPGGSGDAFVAKLNAAGSSLIYATYLGGASAEGGHDIAIDQAGNAYVAGTAEASTDFPTTAGAFQTTSSEFFSFFVAKISVNTPMGTNVTVTAGNGVTVAFATVSASGETAATTSNSGPTPPSGFMFGTPPIFYELTTTASFDPPVSVCIAYDPARFSGSSGLRLMHFENGAWVDVTTSNDTTTFVICGEVSGFSPFAIAQPIGGPLTSLGPASIWVGLANSDDVGIRFDLRAEVYRNGTELVGSGEVTSVPGGSSGFNNARLNEITVASAAGITFVSGDTLSIKLYVRNACAGSRKNSGRARLWFNDSAANSRLVGTIGSPKTFFLRDGFLLASTAGPGPKKTIDVAAGAKCSPYKLFGAWTTNNP